MIWVLRPRSHPLVSYLICSEVTILAELSDTDFTLHASPHSKGRPKGCQELWIQPNPSGSSFTYIDRLLYCLFQVKTEMCLLSELFLSSLAHLETVARENEETLKCSWWVTNVSGIPCEEGHPINCPVGKQGSDIFTVAVCPFVQIQFTYGSRCSATYVFSSPHYSLCLSWSPEGPQC